MSDYIGIQYYNNGPAQLQPQPQLPPACSSPSGPSYQTCCGWRSQPAASCNGGVNWKLFNNCPSGSCWDWHLPTDWNVGTGAAAGAGDYVDVPPLVYAAAAFANDPSFNGHAGILIPAGTGAAGKEHWPYTAPGSEGRLETEWLVDALKNAWNPETGKWALKSGMPLTNHKPLYVGLGRYSGTSTAVINSPMQWRSS